MHRASVRFWNEYNKLTPDIRAQADKQFELLKRDSRHPSLQLKKVGKIWSVRVNLAFRALAVEDGDDFIWFWIGDHREYERLLRTIKKG